MDNWMHPRKSSSLACLLKLSDMHHRANDHALGLTHLHKLDDPGFVLPLGLALRVDHRSGAHPQRSFFNMEPL